LKLSGRFVVALALALLVGWWAAPLPEPAAPLVKPRQDPWRLVALPSRLDAGAAAPAVSGAAFWGKAAASAVTPVATPDPRWRIAALYGVGRERGALIEFAAPDRPAQRLHVGDKLPSGHAIVEINDREVCIRIGAKTYRLGVQRSDPPS
jgi:hypothetical protein